MLWLKAFHIIAVIAWFAGLFYLPRLFVYHAMAEDDIGIQRFVLMERRLYYAIMWPAAILTTLLGAIIVVYAPEYYFSQAWFHWKLFFVGCLWGYHLTCGYFLKKFSQGLMTRSSGFFRLFNEIPTVLLMVVVILVVVKP